MVKPTIVFNALTPVNVAMSFVETGINRYLIPDSLTEHTKYVFFFYVSLAGICICFKHYTSTMFKKYYEHESLKPIYGPHARGGYNIVSRLKELTKGILEKGKEMRQDLVTNVASTFSDDPKFVTSMSVLLVSLLNTTIVLIVVHVSVMILQYAFPLIMEAYYPEMYRKHKGVLDKKESVRPLGVHKKLLVDVAAAHVYEFGIWVGHVGDLFGLLNEDKDSDVYKWASRLWRGASYLSSCTLFILAKAYLEDTIIGKEDRMAANMKKFYAAIYMFILIQAIVILGYKEAGKDNRLENIVKLGNGKKSGLTSEERNQPAVMGLVAGTTIALAQIGAVVMKKSVRNILKSFPGKEDMFIPLLFIQKMDLEYFTLDDRMKEKLSLNTFETYLLRGIGAVSTIMITFGYITLFYFKKMFRCMELAGESF